jgi:hypothetical protein
MCVCVCEREKELEILCKTVHFLKYDRTGLAPFCLSGPVSAVGCVIIQNTQIYRSVGKMQSAEWHIYLQSGMYNNHQTVSE